MNRPVTLDFCFKGDRTYVHGTDLYTAITKFLAQNGMTELSAIDMTIHQICRTNLSGEWVVASQNQTAPKAAAVFRFHGGGV